MRKLVKVLNNLSHLIFLIKVIKWKFKFKKLCNRNFKFNEVYHQNNWRAQGKYIKSKTIQNKLKHKLPKGLIKICYWKILLIHVNIIRKWKLMYLFNKNL